MSKTDDKEYFQQIFTYINTGDFCPSIGAKHRSALRKAAKRFSIKGGDLWYVGGQTSRLVCPTRADQDEALRECHERPNGSGIHWGLNLTQKKINETYYWRTITKDVLNWVKSCQWCCDHAKAKDKITEQEITALQAEETWDIVEVGLMGPFPTTLLNNRFVCTMTDMYSKFVYAVAVPNASSGSIAKAVMQMVYLYGPPRKIVSSQGQVFVNKVNILLLKNFGVKHFITSTYHLQPMGQNEKPNQKIRKALSKYTSGGQTHWDMYLPAVVYSLNTSYQESSSLSPYEAMFNHPVRNIIKLMTLSERLHTVSPAIGEELVLSYLSDLNKQASGGEMRKGHKKHPAAEKQKKIGKRFRQSLRSKSRHSDPSVKQHETIKCTVQPSSEITKNGDTIPSTSQGGRNRKDSGEPQSEMLTEAPQKEILANQPGNLKTDIRYKDEPWTSLTMLLQETPAPNTDSTLEAEKLFQWLISPVTSSDFFNGLWEKKPLLLKRHMPDYNIGLFSSHELHKILKENDLQFTTNIDITSYTDGKRETLNPIGRAHAPVVWDFYKSGCSVRLLNPQTYSDSVWKFNSMLQEYFGSFVGANIYLTPAGSQGFAPHYDDIEAFVLQLEGKKHWRLYSPRNKEEILPRFSSPNFSQDEIGDPIFDTILEPGDLLYFPRGTIHQATTPDDSHSLHITISTCQRNTWGDLLEKLVPQTLQIALNTDPDLHKSLPRDYMQYTGITNSDSSDPRRAAFLQRVGKLIVKLATYAPVDDGTDQMAKGYIHDSLPPKLTPGEQACSIFGNGAICNHGNILNEVEISDDTEVRIVRRGVARLVSEDDQIRIYHTLENSRVYHGKEAQYFEIPADAAPAVELLLNTYPEYITVSSLPLVDECEDKQAELAQVLYERGILVTKKPLQPV